MKKISTTIAAIVMAAGLSLTGTGTAAASTPSPEWWHHDSCVRHVGVFYTHDWLVRCGYITPWFHPHSWWPHDWHSHWRPFDHDHH